MTSAYPDAVAWALAGHGDGQLGHCLLNVVDAFRAPHGIPDAWSSWAVAGGAAGANTHTVLPPPRNVPVYWSGGAHGYGHIAIADDPGYILTTDATKASYGKFTRVKLSWVKTHWGLRYLGWSETLNGKRIHNHVEY